MNTAYRLSVLFFIMRVGCCCRRVCPHVTHYSSSLLSHKHTPWRLPLIHSAPAMRLPGRRAALGRQCGWQLPPPASNHHWSLLNKNASHELVSWLKMAMLRLRTQIAINCVCSLVTLFCFFFAAQKHREFEICHRDAQIRVA